MALLYGFVIFSIDFIPIFVIFASKIYTYSIFQSAQKYTYSMPCPYNSKLVPFHTKFHLKRNMLFSLTLYHVPFSLFPFML